MSTQLLVSAETWEGLTQSYSCDLASETKDGKIVGVRAVEYEGFRYTSFGTMHGPYGLTRKPTIWAYRLLPLRMYEGQTYEIYHDEKAIAAGTRERGDHTGLIVSLKGVKMVCAEKVDFIKGLPAARPISLEEAKVCNAKNGNCGWRSLIHTEPTIEWFSLGGHPVVHYQSERRISRSLFYRAGKRIEEMSIDSDVPLEPVVTKTQSAEVDADAAPGQLALF